MDATPKEIRIYETPQGHTPFSAWMNSVEGQDIYEIVMLRLDNAERGTLGETKSVGSGVSEMIIEHDGGYRIYYGLLGPKGDIVVVLNAGKKKTQDADIKQAQKFWRDKEFNNGD